MTKTFKEIFDETYPIDKLLDDSYLLCEAIGFLKAVSLLVPSYEEDCAKLITSICNAKLQILEKKMEN